MLFKKEDCKFTEGLLLRPKKEAYKKTVCRLIKYLWCNVHKLRNLYIK